MSESAGRPYRKYIDLGEILERRVPDRYRRMPRWTVRLLEELICQRQMNDVINKYIDHIGVSFQPQVIREFDLKLDTRGVENLPENSRCIFAANHPFGIVDGLILTYYVGRKYGDLRAIGNDAFVYVPNLKPLVAAVNVFGQTPRDLIAELDRIYRSDIPITHFPAGVVSRIRRGKVEDGVWQKSFITKALSSRRDIVPFYFEGRNSQLFYSVYLLRRLMRIEANLELGLLPREMFRKRGRTVRVVIGKPISWERFDRSRSHFEWAQRVRAHVYRMGRTDPEIDFE